MRHNSYNVDHTQQNDGIAVQLGLAYARSPSFLDEQSGCGKGSGAGEVARVFTTGTTPPHRTQCGQLAGWSAPRRCK